MFNSKKININLILNGILTILSYGFPLIITMYVSRVLSPNVIGNVSFGTTLISYFSLLCMLGLPIYGMRKCSEVKDNKKLLSNTIVELVIVSLIMFIISIILLSLLVLFIPSLSKLKLLYVILGLGLLFECIGCEWFYKAIGDYKYITNRTIFFRLLSLICILLFVKTDSDYLLYALFLTLVSTCNYICNFINLRKFIDIKLVSNINLKQHLKPLLVFFLMSCTITIFNNLDLLMIGIMKSNDMVAYYGISSKIKFVLTGLGSVIWNVTLPEVTILWNNNKRDEFIKMINKSLGLIYLIQIPLMIYSIFYVNNIVLFIAGNRYIASIIPTIILLFSILPIGISSILSGQVLIPIGSENKLLRVHIIGAIINIILNIILIYFYSINGSAISTVIAEVLVCIMVIIHTNRILNINVINIKLIIKYLIISIISFIPVYFIKYLDISNILILILSFIIYVISYFILLNTFKGLLKE